MYKTSMLAFLLLLCYSVNACELCGCSSGTNFLGILPNFKKHFVGIRMQGKYYTTHHSSAVPEQPISSHEQFYNLDIWARFNVAKKWQLYMLLPLSYNKRAEGNTSLIQSGLGDALLLAYYSLYQNTANDRQQMLQFGTGVKLPTGYNDPTLAYELMQIGSASFDFPISLTYTLRTKKWGLNSEAQYKLNTANQRKFHMGNQCGVSTRVFYWHQRKSFALMPHSGLNYESKSISTDHGKLVLDTEAYSAWHNTGLDLFFKKMGVSAQAAYPLWQHISNGKVQALPKFSIQFNYFF